MAVETVSAPEFEEISVVDYDFHFLYGGTQSFTLFPGDSGEFIGTGDKNYFEVLLQTGPRHVIFLDKVAFYSTNQRVQRRAIKRVAPKVQQPLVPTSAE